MNYGRIAVKAAKTADAGLAAHYTTLLKLQDGDLARYDRTIAHPDVVRKATKAQRIAMTAVRAAASNGDPS